MARLDHLYGIIDVGDWCVLFTLDISRFRAPILPIAVR